MKKKLLTLAAAAAMLTSTLFAKVTVEKDANGWRLFDNGKEVEIKGITWSQTPIGENYNYSLWLKENDYIKKMVDLDMPMLKAMGVNVIRSFDGIPPEWVEYIYDNWGIYTIVNFTMGRYGYTVNGKWIPQTNYQDPATRKTLIADSDAIIERYKDTRGVLFYMLGNESNYGLEWSSPEIENLPVGERHRGKAVYMYSMFNEAMEHAHQIDPNHPIGIVNGDCQYIDLIRDYCPALDIFGTNMYRGWRFYENYYETVRDTLDKPTVITEGGADCYNAITQKEDQFAQLQYYKSQHKEIYQQAYGKGKVGNILGIFVFEWMDEWWKHWQWKNLTIHDTESSWSNSGLSLDWREGKNNMDEEWFGIVAQSQIMEDGLNKRVPRATYYFLQDLWTHHSLYHSTNAEINEFFDNLPEGVYLARGIEQSIRDTIKEDERFKLSSMNATVQMTTPVYVNGLVDYIQGNGKFENIKDAFTYRNDQQYSDTTADSYVRNSKAAVNKPTVSAETSITMEVKPVENVSGTVTLRAWTAEPFSRLQDHWYNYYEDYPDTAETAAAGNTVYDHQKYVDFYSASMTYNNSLFDLNAYYHVGHAGFETSGDYFNLSKEAFDIIGYDTYGSKAPICFEFVGKGKLGGLSVIAGPEIWGGAQPMFIANWSKWMPSPKKGIPSFYVAATWREEFGQSSYCTLDPYNLYGAGMKASVYADMYWETWLTGRFGLLTAGNQKIGAQYYSVDGTIKEISILDTLAGYLELGTNVIPYTYIYADGIYRGLVADTEAQQVRGSFFTGDSGSGNRIEAKLGAEVNYGPHSFKPVVRYRKPLEDAAGRTLFTATESSVWAASTSYMCSSPFIVGLGNREALEVEAVYTFDLQGGTWFHDWNNDDTETAKLAFSVTGFYQLFAGATDIIPYKDDAYALCTNTITGETTYGQLWRDWGGALGEQSNLFQFGTRVVWNPIPNWKIIANLGMGHLGGICGSALQEYVTFYTGGIKTRYNHWIGGISATINGWGAEGWYRNFNNTFPLQYTLDIAYGFGKPSFLDSTNRIGMKVVGRTFGEYSADAYHALPYYLNGSVNGAHYMEVTGYVSIGL